MLLIATAGLILAIRLVKDLVRLAELIILVALLNAIDRVVRHLVRMLTHHVLKVGIVGLTRLELAMHDFERIRDRVVLSFECAETGQNRVVDSLHQDDSVKRIEVLRLQVVVPLLDLQGHLGQVAGGCLLSSLNIAKILTGEVYFHCGATLATILRAAHHLAMGCDGTA